MDHNQETCEAEKLDDMFRLAWDARAQQLYERYGKSVGWTAVSGHPMPSWEEVRDNRRVHGAWCIVACEAEHGVMNAYWERRRASAVDTLRLLFGEAHSLTDAIYQKYAERHTVVSVLFGDVTTHLNRAQRSLNALADYFVRHPPEQQKREPEEDARIVEAIHGGRVK